MTIGLVPAAFATTQDDAGSGGDAPNSSGGSPVIYLPVGTSTGEVVYSAGDREDWYQISIPCGPFQVSFRATTGSAWGGIYTSTGTFIQNARSTGQTVTLNQVAAGTYRFGIGDHTLSTGSATYTITVQKRLPHNDAPAGCDAPQTGPALDLGLGSYSGALTYGGTDNEDWYRFSVGSCGISVTITSSSGGFYAGLYQESNGAMVAQSYVTSGSSATLTAYGQNGYRLGVGDQSGSGSASYSFTAAKWQNDANTGCDASNTFAAANWVGTGSYSGKLAYDVGDKEDWYRHSSGCANSELTVSLSNAGAWVGVYSDSGTLLADRYVSAGSQVTFDIVADGFHFGIGDSSATSGRPDYSFTVTTLTADSTGVLCAGGPVAVAL